MKIIPSVVETSSKILFDEAEKLGFQPQWENKFGFFSFFVNGEIQHMFHTKLFINSQLGAWVSKNKHITHIVLESHGFKMIPYCRSNVRRDIYAFFRKYKRIVKKPVVGQQAEGVEVISDKDGLSKLPKSIISTSLFEQYIQGTEYRYLVLENSIIAVQKKKRHPTPTRPWNSLRKNLDRKEWDEKLMTIALRVSNVLHLGFVSVDFMTDEVGESRILETNALPSLYYFHFPHEGEPQNIARILLKELYMKSDR